MTSAEGGVKAHLIEAIHFDQIPGVRPDRGVRCTCGWERYGLASDQETSDAWDRHVMDAREAAGLGGHHGPGRSHVGGAGGWLERTDPSIQKRIADAQEAIDADPTLLPIENLPEEWQ